MRRSVVWMVTALMVGGLVSCSDDDQSSSTTEEQITVAVGDVTTTATTEENQSTTSATSLAATSTVTVTVTDVEDAVGYDLAGVLFRGDEPLIANVVGGFGAAVEADPFSTTQVVRTPQYGPEDFPEDFDFGIDWPFVTDGCDAGARNVLLAALARATPTLLFQRLRPG